jgi:hypothetical protein
MTVLGRRTSSVAAIANRTDSLWDISADQARRPADALVQLADILERS